MRYAYVRRLQSRTAEVRSIPLILLVAYLEEEIIISIIPQSEVHV